jgi:serine/threonine protein kinase
VSAISRETETLKRLQSIRSVVQLLDCFEDDDECHVVTELLPGGDLQRYVVLLPEEPGNDWLHE